METTTFAPTHRTPATGLPSWPRPDPAAPIGPRLGAGLHVQPLRSAGAWVEVLCSNGWRGWVDGRRLEAAVDEATVDEAAVDDVRVDGVPVDDVPADAAAVEAVAATPLLLAGGALAIVSSFLSWITFHVSVGSISATQSTSAWDLPLWGVVMDRQGLDAVKVAHVVLAVALATGLLVARRSLVPYRVVGAAGAAVFAIAAVSAARALTFDDGSAGHFQASTRPGAGAVLALVAGGLLLVDAARRRAAAAA